MGVWRGEWINIEKATFSLSFSLNSIVKEKDQELLNPNTFSLETSFQPLVKQMASYCMIGTSALSPVKLE